MVRLLKPARADQTLHNRLQRACPPSYENKEDEYMAHRALPLGPGLLHLSSHQAHRAASSILCEHRCGPQSPPHSARLDSVNFLRDRTTCLCISTNTVWLPQHHLLKHTTLQDNMSRANGNGMSGHNIQSGQPAANEQDNP